MIENDKIRFFRVNFCFLMLSFWGFLILLFLICFFRHFIIPISIDYQYVTSNQQDFKKKNVMPITGRSPMSRCSRAQPSIASYTGGGGIAVVCSLLWLEFFCKFIIILNFLDHILVGLKCLLHICSGKSRF